MASGPSSRPSSPSTRPAPSSPWSPRRASPRRSAAAGSGRSSSRFSIRTSPSWWRSTSSCRTTSATTTTRAPNRRCPPSPPASPYTRSRSPTRHAPRGGWSSRPFGRGTVIKPGDPRSIRRAIKQLRAGAAKNPALTADAGLLAEDFDQLGRDDLTVRDYVRGKRARVQERSERSERSYVLAIAIEGLFDLYRARARLAAAGDEKLTEKLLGLLPRTVERRRSTKKIDEAPPVSLPATVTP